MTRIKFSRKPMPLTAEYRPAYKIFQVLLILYYSSRSGKSSLIRLHLINWSLKSEERKNRLTELYKNYSGSVQVWGMDPALNFALQYGVAQKLITQITDTYSITSLGKSLIVNAEKEQITHPDSHYLKSIGKKITENMVQEIVKKWN